MNLIIVESPTKAKTLGKFLGKEYEVVPTMGHLVDLPKSKLGVDLEHDFAPIYVEVEKKAETLKTIKNSAKKASKIYLATDPDREGEAIAKHVEELLTGPVGGSSRHPTNIARVVFHEITESAVRHALDTPREVDLKLYDAQQARRVLDRLVGYKLSPLLWKKVRRGLSAGRVQSVTVRLIVEKEREIEAFKTDEYWEIFVLVSLENKQHAGEFTVKLAKVNDEKIEVKHREQADKVVSELERAKYSVLSVDKREVRKSPLAPYTTSTMAQNGASNFGWSAKRTMSIAQKLYEEGLITYHRTDSTNLAVEAINMARAYIGEKFGKNYLPEKPRIYKVSSRVAQEAHEAIRPTDVGRVSNDQWPVSNGGNDAKKLYELIWKRFVACQMSQAVIDETSIKVQADGEKSTSYELRASGQIVKFDGWRTVYGDKYKAIDGEPVLPEVVQGDPLNKLKVDPQQKFTQPPARFTEASLIKTLEKLGIGRPSTYAPTITTIQTRQYVEKDEGKFKPTVLGLAVNDFLVKNFGEVVDYQFTAGMEEDLDKIAAGTRKWVPVMREFWDPFVKILDRVTDKAERVHIAVEKTGDKCPKCDKGEQVIRMGRFGKFLSCSLFPECDWKDNYMETINVKCPDCKVGDVIIRKTKKGRKFFGCSMYPDCKFASWKKPGGESNGGA